MTNVPITYGTGQASIAGDTVGSTTYQQIKVVDGTAGGSTGLIVNADGTLNARISGSVLSAGSTFNGSVSGTVGASIIGAAPVRVEASVATVIIGGSIAASFTPPANQSVSGTVGASLIGTAPVTQAGTWIASVFGNVSVLGTVPVTQSTSPWIITGSVQGTAAANQSVSGVVQVSGGTSPSSIVTAHIVDDPMVSSMVALVTDTIIHGRTTAGGGSYVEVKVDPSGALVMASSSVVSFQGGTQISSLVSTVPSSVLVGASIFGALPAGNAVLGAVAASVTGAVNVSGSVVGFLSSTNASVITVSQGSVAAQTTITSIATANGGLPIYAPLTSRVQGIADLRVVQGASVAALPAAGSGVRNYVEHVQIANFGSSSVLVAIADNTTSILGWTIAPAGGGSNFRAFYRGSPNSPITASINGTASVLVSMQGFTSST